MKTLIVLVMAIGVGGMLFYFVAKPSSIGYTKPVEQVPVEVKVDALQKRVTEAQEKAKASIEAKAKQAYDQAVAQELLEIELQETANYRKEIEAKEKELQKKSVSY